MSHFAQVINGIVENVIVAEQDVIDSGLFGDPNDWVQTSYNTRGGVHYDQNDNPDDGIPLRANYAVIGGSYDKENDVFYSPRPLDINGELCKSWTIGSPDWKWTAPVPMPPIHQNGYVLAFVWDETTQTWNEESRARAQLTTGTQEF